MRPSNKKISYAEMANIPKNVLDLNSVLFSACTKTEKL